MAAIYKEYMGPISEKQVATVSDLEIRRCVESYGDDNIENGIKYDGSWELFVHMSKMRRNLLSWYKFKTNAEVLEVDAGNGALTGLLCEKCKYVTSTVFSAYRAETILKRYCDRDNLDIYVGTIGAIKFKKKFDYIILLGSLEIIQKEKRENYLKIIIGLLKRDGVLLCAVDNRYGLRYLCGARELHTGHPYEGLNGYVGETKGYSFGKKELTELLENVGLKNRRFYYPLPDYIVTQSIYSDDLLPEEDAWESIYPAYWGYDTLRVDENLMFKTAVNNQVFPLVASSFLVECSREELIVQNITLKVPYKAIPFKHKNFEVVQSATNKIFSEKNVLCKNDKWQYEESLNLSKAELDRLDDIKKVQIDIFQEFVRICEKYKLTFFVFRGTLLGAIRHNGYIPWDDDIDVVMPRKDFGFLKKAIQKELSKPYFFQSVETDDNYFGGSMCRIRNINTTGISMQEFGRKGKFGIWIDILVLDNLFVEKRKQLLQLKKITFWKKALMIKTYGNKDEKSSSREIDKKIFFISKIFSRKTLIKRFDRACRMCSDEKTNIYCIFNIGVSDKSFLAYDKSDFRNKIDWNFETFKVPVPIGYDHVLQKIFYKNYLKFPDIEKMRPKHDGIFDADIPYWKFSTIWTDELKEKIFLLGENKLIEFFLNKYGNNREVRIGNLALIKLYQSEDNEDLIICANDYKPYVWAMEENGISDYFIFVSEEENVIGYGT